MRRLNLVSYLSFCTKVNSKWIKDFNAIPKILNYYMENIYDVGTCKDFSEQFCNTARKKGKV
jgi:hypothetical protein